MTVLTLQVAGRITWPGAESGTLEKSEPDPTAPGSSGAGVPEEEFKIHLIRLF